MLLCNGPGERWLDPPNHQVVFVSSALARIEDSTSATFLRYIQRDKTSLPIAWGTVRLGGAISPHPQTWCYNAPGARPMIDNSGRRLTTINNTMSCLHVMTSSLCVVMVIESPLLISHVQFELLLQKRGMG